MVIDEQFSGKRFIDDNQSSTDPHADPYSAKKKRTSLYESQMKKLLTYGSKFNNSILDQGSTVKGARSDSRLNSLSIIKEKRSMTVDKRRELEFND